MSSVFRFRKEFYALAYMIFISAGDGKSLGSLPVCDSVGVVPKGIMPHLMLCSLYSWKSIIEQN
jgi:hypothetical protein